MAQYFPSEARTVRTPPPLDDVNGVADGVVARSVAVVARSDSIATVDCGGDDDDDDIVVVVAVVVADADTQMLVGDNVRCVVVLVLAAAAAAAAAVAAVLVASLAVAAAADAVAAGAAAAAAAAHLVRVVVFVRRSAAIESHADAPPATRWAPTLVNVDGSSKAYVATYVLPHCDVLAPPCTFDDVAESVRVVRRAAVCICGACATHSKHTLALSFCVRVRAMSRA